MMQPKKAFLESFIPLGKYNMQKSRQKEVHLLTFISFVYFLPKMSPWVWICFYIFSICVHHFISCFFTYYFLSDTFMSLRKAILNGTLQSIELMCHSYFNTPFVAHLTSPLLGIINAAVNILLQKAFSLGIDSQKWIKENEQFKPITLRTVISRLETLEDRLPRK